MEAGLRAVSKEEQRATTGPPRFAALRRHCVFCRSEVFGHAALLTSVCAIFPLAFAHSVSLRHVFKFLRHGKCPLRCFLFIAMLSGR